MTKNKTRVAMVVAICAALISTLAPACADSTIHGEASYKPSTTQDVTDAVNRAVASVSQRMSVGMHIHGRSKPSAQTTSSRDARSGVYPIRALSPAQMQGLGGLLHQYRWTLTRTRSLQVVAWTRANENLSQTAVIGGSALLCAIIFSETVVGALPAAGACGFMVALEWANFKDAVYKISPWKPCLQVTLNQVPTFFGVSWLSFSARKCPRGK
jgi:hypothetical protein